MTLQYSFLEEVFPGWNNEVTRPIARNSLDIMPFREVTVWWNNEAKSKPTVEVAPPEYTRTCKPFEIKPWQKLRILSDELVVENRLFPFLMRRRSGESRWKILKKIKTLPDVNFQEYLLEELRKTTYSKDAKWVKESYRSPLDIVV
jgi:hypothetical protein